MKRWFFLFCVFLVSSSAVGLSAQQAKLRVLNGSGSPGSTGNPLFIELSNSTQVRVIQFALHFDGNALSISDVQPTGRTDDMGTFSWLLLDSGTVMIRIQDLTGPIIETGVGPIATVYFDVREGHLGGEIILSLSDATLFDPSSNPLSVHVESGKFRITVPNISLQTQSFNFGYVLLGSSKEWIATLRNEGTGTLRISNITSDNFEFAITSPPFPQDVAPGDSLGVTIIFSPSLEGPRSASVFIHSNDPDEPHTFLSLTGGGTSVDIEVSATEHDFGITRIGSFSDWLVTIHNLGVAELTVFDITSDHSNFEVSQPVFPQVIFPSDSLDVQIEFLPASRGVLTATLTLTCNDPDEGSISLTVSGTGVAPDIQFSTTSHHFGGIEVGTSEGWLFTIINLGTADLTVSTVSSDNPEFSVTLPTFPQTIPSGPAANHIDVVITFAPTHVGERSADVTIESDDPFHPNSILTLSGEGLPSAHLQIGQGSGYPGTTDNVVSVYMTNRKSVATMFIILNYNASNIHVSNVTPTELTAQMSIFSWSEPIIGKIVLLAEDLTNQVGPGSGAIAQFYFDVDVDADPSEELIVLSDVVLSDAHGDTVFTIFDQPGIFTISAPEIALSSTSYSFGHVVLGNSATWTLKIYNKGTTELLVTGITTTHGDFSVFIPELPQSISAQGSLAVAVQFTPSSLGTVTGAVTVVSNDPDEGLLSVHLNGNGVVPNIELSAYSHHFGEVVLGTASPWSITVYNTGTADLIVTHTAIDQGDFLITSPLFPQTLEPEDSAVVELSFSPSSLGTITGTLTLYSNDLEEGDLSLILMGVGIAPDIDVMESSHDFAEVVVGGTSNWVMRIFNTGTADLIISNINTSNTDFHILAPTFPQTISSNNFLDVMISFSPSDEGTITGQLTILSNDIDESSFSVLVEGEGVAADIFLPANSHNFDEVLVMTSDIWTFNILNFGVVLLEVEKVTTNSSNFSIMTPSFPQTVMPGDTLRVTVLFGPTALGVLRDTVEVHSSDPDENILVIPVQGTGVAPHIDLSADDHDFGGVVVGRSLNWQLSLQNTGTYELHITQLTLTNGTEFTKNQITLPYTLSPTSSVIITVTFNPVNAGLKVDTLTIMSSDLDRPVITVSFAGQGIPPPELSVLDRYGQPGTSGNIAPINLVNEMAISKAEFLLQYDADRFAVTDVKPTVRDQHMDTFSWSEATAGRMQLTIDDSGANVIDAGRGWIIEVYLDVKADALEGDVIMALTDVSLFDEEGVILPKDVSEGVFSIVQTLDKVTIAAPHRSRPAGDTFTVPIKLVSDITGLNVFALQFNIVFDPQILTAVEISDRGTLAEFWRQYPQSEYHFAQGIQAGRIVAVFAAAIPLWGDGTFVNITFEVSPDAQPGGVSPLHFENFRVNEGYPLSEFSDGWFSVASVPDIDFSFREHDFDSTTIGLSKSWQLTIFNEGTEELIVDSMVSTESDFILGDVSLPRTLASEGHFDVIVYFQPSRLGEISGLLEVISNDIDEPTALVALRGIGVSEVGVELVNLTGEWTGEDIIIEWSVSSLYDISGFHIDRKTGMEEYQRLTTLPIEGQDHLLYHDRQIFANGTYSYRLNAVYCDGVEECLGTIAVKVTNAIISSYFLAQNYPNPFNPGTYIQYGLAQEGWVSLYVYNTLGQKVRTLIDGVQFKGNHTVFWDGRNDRDEAVPSGIYYYRLDTSGFSDTRTMLLLR